jgi:hypothetical protein
LVAGGSGDFWSGGARSIAPAAGRFSGVPVALDDLSSGDARSMTAVGGCFLAFFRSAWLLSALLSPAVFLVLLLEPSALFPAGLCPLLLEAPSFAAGAASARPAPFCPLGFPLHFALGCCWALPFSPVAALPRLATEPLVPLGRNLACFDRPLLLEAPKRNSMRRIMIVVGTLSSVPPSLRD